MNKLLLQILLLAYAHLQVVSMVLFQVVRIRDTAEGLVDLDHLTTELKVIQPILYYSQQMSSALSSDYGLWWRMMQTVWNHMNIKRTQIYVPLRFDHHL